MKYKLFLVIGSLLLSVGTCLNDSLSSESKIIGANNIFRAILPTGLKDSYKLSPLSYKLDAPTKIINVEDWKTGFSIKSTQKENILDVSFRFIYKDGTASDLFIINENTEDICEDAKPSTTSYTSQLYTSTKTLLSIEFYYLKAQQFDVYTYPVEIPVQYQAKTVADSDKIAYKKEFMTKIGLNIITRDEWGAPTTMSEIFSTTGVNRIVVHHTATSVNLADPKVTVKAIFDYHNCSVEDYYAGKCPSNICCDIGYNYLIDPYGNLYEGRHGYVRTRGAHAIPNSGSIGIALLGNFETEQPTQAALNTLTKLVAGLSDIYNIDLNMTRDFTTGYQQGLEGHKDVIGCLDGVCTPVATACPGANLYSLLNTIKNNAISLKNANSQASIAYTKAKTITERNNFVVKDGYAEIILYKQGLEPALNPANYSDEDNILFGIKVIEEYSDYLVVGVAESQYVQYIAEILMLNPESKIQPNYVYEISDIGINDALADELWALDNTGQSVNGITGTDNADINAPEAWGVTEGNTDNVIVAVIDTGVAYEHPDLKNMMWDGSTCVDEDNDPIVDGCLHGYDYMSTDNNPLPDPLASYTIRHHGTHIAGIIGAERNNSIGVAGIAPKVKIMAIRSSFSSISIIKEINFAKYNGAKIINASWGTYGAPTCMFVYDESLYNAIASFPGLVVVAAGNSDEDHNLINYFSAPADYSHDTECWTGLNNIITVGASDQDDEKAGFSDYGIGIDIVAPGSNILSTTDNTIYESYGYGGGTSMATPYVSGLAAYVWSTDIDQTSTQIKDKIINGGDTLSSLCYLFNSQKRINAYNAINGITTSNDVCPDDITPPTINAGTDIHSYPNVNRTLNGTSSDGQSGVQSNVWSKFSGPGTVTFDDEIVLNSDVSANQVGTYVLRLTSTDRMSNSTFDDINLYIHKTADYNNDTYVDEIDFAYLAINWGGSNQMADFNGDGYIDEIDFALLAINWTST